MSEVTAARRDGGTTGEVSPSPTWPDCAWQVWCDLTPRMGQHGDRPGPARPRRASGRDAGSGCTPGGRTVSPSGGTSQRRAGTIDRRSSWRARRRAAADRRARGLARARAHLRGRRASRRVWRASCGLPRNPPHAAGRPAPTRRRGLVGRAGRPALWMPGRASLIRWEARSGRRGRKVVGSAQLREGGALLQHGSILLADDQRVVGSVTRGPAPDDESGPLAPLLGREISVEQAAAAVVEAASECWGLSASHRAEPSALMIEAQGHLARFRSPGWTWRR